ncbi:MAG TPA: aminotransferase class I/II-fold pyridoxal phosphate-dependent enzyme [Chthoniobacterales bacterium]|nr:aminotransferase class I/II-fold pyridoxal phosphate-dependent enzyme [Chthoniobacterales bacterium]
MPEKKICLASDNWTPVHPLIIKAITEANEGYAPAYGSDAWTEEAGSLIQKVFKNKCKVFVVPTGTGANIFALRLCCKAYESVICTDIAHIQYQESGATEALIGCKLLTVPNKEGKVTAAEIVKKLKRERAFGKHSTSPRVLSITQPTEIGTVYTLEELKALSKVIKEENLLLHIDGSRLYNAAISLNTSLHEIAEAAHVDILSLGGTKNGLMGAEALVIFNPSLQEGSDHLQKQMLQLLSKTRYLSAQYIPFFKNDLWHTLATQANQKAKEIASIIESTSGLSLSYPVETNQIFFIAPASWIPLIQEKIFCYPWDAEKNEVRFIASWNTSEQDVKEIRSILSEISKHSK